MPEYLTEEEMLRFTIESRKRVEPIMRRLDQEVRRKNVQELIQPNFRIYQSPLFSTWSGGSKRNAFVTSIFLTDEYVGSALVLAKNLRLLGTREVVVCMVQDKSYRIRRPDGTAQIFGGVGSEKIADLLELYDMVIGVDLLRVQSYTPSPKHFTQQHVGYSNIPYYVTKGQVLGLNLFEKIMYLDASAYLEKNVDYVFQRNDTSTFLEDYEFSTTELGIHGAFFLYVYDPYVYHKFRLLISDYNRFFGRDYFIRGVDELVIYYAVYPNWNASRFNLEFACRKNRSQGAIEGCDIYHFQMEKPFRKHSVDGDDPRKHYEAYDDWDKLVKILLRSHPHFAHYFEGIPAVRQVRFDLV